MLSKAFKTLRIPRNAGVDEIRKAYVKLVRRYPPEHFPEKFSQVKTAFDHLTMAQDSVSHLLEEMADAETVTGLKSFLFGDMVEESEPGQGISSLHYLADSDKLVSPEDLLAGLDSDKIEYRRRPGPNSS